MLLLKQFIGFYTKERKNMKIELVRLGYVANREDGISKAAILGYRLLGDDALKTFLAKNPKPDGKGPIIFGAALRKDRYGLYRNMTVLYENEGNWDIRFEWTKLDWGYDHRWAVMKKTSEKTSSLRKLFASLRKLF